MSDPDKTQSDAERIAAIVAGEISAAPQPPFDDGTPAEPFGDDGEMLPHDLDHDAMRRIEPDTIAACARQPQNDTGNGQRLLAHFGHELLNVREIGWHTWSGTHWEREGGNESARRCAHRTAERIALEADYIAASPIERIAIEEGDAIAGELAAIMKKAESDMSESDKKERRRLQRLADRADEAREAISKRRINRRKFAVSTGNSSRIVGMLDQALPYRTVTPDRLDADPLQFNLANGTLRFVRAPDPECPDPDAVRLTWTAQIGEHDREALITKRAPVEYDAAAECPRFSEFMERFQPNAGVRRFLQTYHGYALTGLIGEQCLVFNYGLGANGKSTLVEAIARIMGPYACTLSFESLVEAGIGRRGDQATPDIARLPGVRMVRASEPKRGARFDEALIKSMTGGEPMLVRHLQKGFFEFAPVFKLILSGNHKPEIGGIDYGIWRRVRLVPWTVRIAKEEQRPMADVLAEFWEERSGILNWLIDGALNYLNSGLTVPPEVAGATEDYRDEMDPIGGFIRDCVTISQTPADRDPPSVTAREMYLAFAAWCEVNSIRPWKENAFGRAMPMKGIVRTKERVRRYLDVALHDVPALPRRSDAVPPPDDDDLVPN